MFIAKLLKKMLCEIKHALMQGKIAHEVMVGEKVPADLAAATWVDLDVNFFKRKEL
jgi:hypothetical protein